MLCEGLVPEARREHIPQKNIELIYCYSNIVQHLRHPGTVYGTNQSNTHTQHFGEIKNEVFFKERELLSLKGPVR